jgi:hypothetical protein
LGERQAKVRPEFEAWYPGVLPGLWYSANRLREVVVAQLRGGQPRWEPEGRVPSDVHFEFRGGETGRLQERTRRDDRPREDRPMERRVPGD